MIDTIKAMIEAGKKLDAHKYRGSAPAPQMCDQPSDELRAAWNEWMDSSHEHSALDKTFAEATTKALPDIERLLKRAEMATGFEKMARNGGVAVIGLSTILNLKNENEQLKNDPVTKAALELAEAHMEYIECEGNDEASHIRYDNATHVYRAAKAANGGEGDLPNTEAENEANDPNL